MNDTRKQIFAVGAIVIMMMAGFTAVVASDESDDSEVDGLFWMAAPIAYYSATTVAKWLIGTAVVAGLAGVAVGSLITDPATTDPLNRAHEAEILATSLGSGVEIYQFSLANYANIWGATNEHWIRQAELAAAANWNLDTSYNTDLILESSDVYSNISALLVNSAAQINLHYQDIGERTHEWNNTEYAQLYNDGKMELSVDIGGERFSASAGEDWNVMIGTIMDNVTDSANRAYLAGGGLFVSEATTIYKDGKPLPLEKGYNNLGDVEEFDDGIYTFTSGITYCGNIAPILGSNDAEVHAGLAIDVNDKIEFLTAVNLKDSGENMKPVCDVRDSEGRIKDGISIAITPQESENEEVIDVTDTLASFEQLVNVVKNTLGVANAAAATVWSMYDDAGSASAYLTTLVVPETYNNVNLTPEQQRMITTLAMEQLYQYWDQNGHAIKQDSYVMTHESLSLYCKGDITVTSYSDSDVSRSVTYENVIFTPIFDMDYTITEGTNRMSKYGFVMIWGSGEDTNLADFNVSNAEEAELIFLDSGAIMNIASNGIYYTDQNGDSRYYTSFDLDATDIEFIDPDHPYIPDPPTPTPQPSELNELIRLILVILGLGLVLFGFQRGNWIIAIIGILVAVCGFVLSDHIANALEDWFGWKFRWP